MPAMPPVSSGSFGVVRDVDALFWRPRDPLALGTAPRLASNGGIMGCVSCRTRSHASYRFKGAQPELGPKLLALAGPTKGKEVAKWDINISIRRYASILVRHAFASKYLSTWTQAAGTNSSAPVGLRGGRWRSFLGVAMRLPCEHNDDVRWGEFCTRRVPTEDVIVLLVRAIFYQDFASCGIDACAMSVRREVSTMSTSSCLTTSIFVPSLYTSPSQVSEEHIRMTKKSTQCPPNEVYLNVVDIQWALLFIVHICFYFIGTELWYTRPHFVEWRDMYSGVCVCVCVCVFDFML